MDRASKADPTASASPALSSLRVSLGSSRESFIEASTCDHGNRVHGPEPGGPGRRQGWLVQRRTADGESFLETEEEREHLSEGPGQPADHLGLLGYGSARSGPGPPSPGTEIAGTTR